MSRYRKKGATGRPHVGIDLGLMYSGKFMELSKSAALLYLYAKSRYRPGKNGEIKLSYRFMQKVRGFRSFNATSKALNELIEKGWLERVTPGGLLGHSSYYKITFKCEYYANEFNTKDEDAEARKNAKKLWKR